MEIAKNVVNTFEGWSEALEKMLKVQSYKKFFAVTSKFEPIVVENDSTLFEDNKKGFCHLNCKEAERKGLGKRVSGWFVMNELTHEDMYSGMCRLVHHSNLLLPNGKFVNPTICGEEVAHIFIQDDERDFDFTNKIGFNDRMVFGDSFLVGKSVPRNKVHFAALSEFSRDVYFEKFKIYASREETMKVIPQNISYQEQVKWMTLKTTCHL
jgi:hypothetical protein